MERHGVNKLVLQTKYADGHARRPPRRHLTHTKAVRPLALPAAIRITHRETEERRDPQYRSHLQRAACELIKQVALWSVDSHVIGRLCAHLMASGHGVKLAILPPIQELRAGRAGFNSRKVK